MDADLNIVLSRKIGAPFQPELAVSGEHERPGNIFNQFMEVQKERIMKVASIVVDFRHVRCSNCKVALHDELATECAICAARFDSITSNHVGLAERLHKKRRAAGVHERSIVQHEYELSNNV